MQATPFSRTYLALSIISFIISMVPLHFWPPVMAAPNFTSAWIGDQFIDLYTYAFHLGFGLAALLLLAISRSSAIRASHLQLISTVLAQVFLVFGVFFGGAVSVICRFLLGATAVPSYAAAYAYLKISRQEYRVPAMLGLSSLFLETSALTAGIAVKAFGYIGGLTLASVIGTSLTVVLLLFTFWVQCSAPAASHVPGVSKTDFKGSPSLMTIAVIAHGAFFLMLAGLGQVQGQGNGAQIIGAAVFSTALAFPLGSMIPLEKASVFRAPESVTLFGSLISLTGIVINLLAIKMSLPFALVVGTAITAFGNGATLSRCFQNASVESPDGESSPVLIMAGVMLFTVILGFAMQVFSVDGLGAAAASFVLNLAVSAILSAKSRKEIKA